MIKAIIDNIYDSNEESVNPKIIALNEHGLLKEFAHNKTSFYEAMIDGIYDIDNEVINPFVD